MTYNPFANGLGRMAAFPHLFEDLRLEIVSDVAKQKGLTDGICYAVVRNNYLKFKNSFVRRGAQAVYKIEYGEVTRI